MSLTGEEVLRRYRRAKSDAEPEHKRLVEEAAELNAAYGLDSIRGKDFADLSKVWGSKPPEVGMLLSNTNVLWGQFIQSRRDPSFPGFDQSAEDEVVGEMLTELSQAARRWARSDGVDAEALHDLILSGYAFGEDGLDTDCRPPFRPFDRYIPISDIWWDTSGNEANLRDAEEFIRRHRYSISEAAARYPDHADIIRALDSSGGSGGLSSAPGDGARSLGGKNVTVQVSSADGKTTSGTSSRRLRQVAVDDFQFLEWENLIAWTDEQEGEVEVRQEQYDAQMEQRETEAAAQGQLFQRPAVRTYAQGTWYRAMILAESGSGEPLVLTPAAPIPGNQPLIKCMTGYPERYLDGETMRTRYFAFGRVLLGIQRLTSVAIRVEIEQEARRNRSGGSIDEDAFDSPQAKKAWIDAQAVPGAWGTNPPGAYDKIHPNQLPPSPHVGNMQGLFTFFAKDLPAYALGVSDLNRGTFDGDRSAKFLATQADNAITMQTRLSTAFTDWTHKGAVTQLRLMLGPEGLDAVDIDRLLGRQKLREGLTGQRDEQGQLQPIPETDEQGQPVLDASGQRVNVTMGSYLKKNVPEVLDNDVSFALRPSAASERMATAMLTTQHGFFDDILKVLPPGAGKILIPAMLKASWAPGTIYAEAAEELESYLKQQEEQEQQQQQAATEQGWLGFLQQTAQSDPAKAQELLQQAMQAMGGGGGAQSGQGQQQGVQGAKPPTESINFKDVGPEAKLQMLAQAGIQVSPGDVASPLMPPPVAPGLSPGLPPGGPIQ
jgi:hypothetical protein